MIPRWKRSGFEMATGFHRSLDHDRSRKNWQRGTAINKATLQGKKDLRDAWAAAGGWQTNPEYMLELNRQIRLQEQYLRARGASA